MRVATKAKVLGWMLAALLPVGAAGAEDEDGRSRLALTLDTRLTWTDNVTASHDKNADWFMEVSPGLRAERHGGRLQGALNARFRNIAHAREHDRDTSFVALQGAGAFEALENTLFFDFDANVGREGRSLFSGRAQGDDSSITKDDEVRAWGLGPRLQFRLGDVGEGLLRYRASWLDSGLRGFGKQRQNLWVGQFGNPHATRFIGWEVSYQDGRTHYDSTRQRVRQQLGRAALYVNLSGQFRLRFTAGHESNDYGHGSGERGAIYGGGFDWYPTPRTAISVLSEERPHGNGYEASFRHRTGRTVWNVAAVRDISSSLDSLGGGIHQDPVFQSYYNHPVLIAQFPDAATREAYIRLLLGYPPVGGTGEFISNAYFLDESWRAGVAFNGARDSLVFSIQRSKRRRLSPGTGLSVGDDFALTDRIDTDSATVSFNHRLTPLSALSAALARSRSEGGAGLDTWRTTATVSLDTRLGPRARAGVSYRYLRSDGATLDADYSENAVAASLGLTF